MAIGVRVTTNTRVASLTRFKNAGSLKKVMDFELAVTM
jgi:hypothetical protein